MGAPAVSPRVRPAPATKPKPKPRALRTASPARTRPAPRRSRGAVAAGSGFAMLPINAIGGIADSPFVVGITRGRAWIVILGVLLGGIVAINVLGLSLSAAGSDTSTRIDELQQQNSVLRTRIANRLSNERISDAAAALGLAVPAPDDVRYLDSSSSDAEHAAQRLAAGEIAATAPAEPVQVAVADPATADPAATTTTATTVAPPPDPAAVTTTTAPVATTPVDPTTTVP